MNRVPSLQADIAEVASTVVGVLNDADMIERNGLPEEAAAIRRFIGQCHVLVTMAQHTVSVIEIDEAKVLLVKAQDELNAVLKSACDKLKARRIELPPYLARGDFIIGKRTKP